MVIMMLMVMIVRPMMLIMLMMLILYWCWCWCWYYIDADADNGAGDADDVKDFEIKRWSALPFWDQRCHAADQPPSNTHWSLPSTFAPMMIIRSMMLMLLLVVTKGMLQHDHSVATMMKIIFLILRLYFDNFRSHYNLTYNFCLLIKLNRPEFCF